MGVGVDTTVGFSLLRDLAASHTARRYGVRKASPSGFVPLYGHFTWKQDNYYVYAHRVAPRRCQARPTARPSPHQPGSTFCQLWWPVIEVLRTCETAHGRKKTHVYIGLPLPT